LVATPAQAAYRDATTNSGSSATPAATVPSGVVANDVVVVACGIDSPTAAFDVGDLPADFTELAETDITADGHSA
jgi:hypothetical protein